MTTMAPEDQTQKCSNGGGLGRSSKKPKQKKVPQRGLGVAQLEKIRLEEQQKKDAAVAAAAVAAAAAAILPSPSPVSSSSKSSHLPLPIQNFHRSNQPSSPIPLPSGSSTDFRSPLSLQHMDAKVSSTDPLDFEKDSSGVVDPRLAFASSLPWDSNPIWSLPSWVQRTPQSHHPSSMVNVSSGTSSSTPVPHFLTEPPSNQNYSGSSSVPMRPEEKNQMVGMKRPYPFSLDVPPVPAFNFKLPTFAATRTNATTSCGSGFNFDAGTSSFREVPSCSASNSGPNSKKSNKENEFCNGDFLTLSPPNPNSCPPSKFKLSSTFLAFHNQEYPDFESLSCQGITEDQTPPPPSYSQFNQQKQPFYSFFPPAAKEAQIEGEATARIQNCNEVGESVDLNLKL